MQSLLEEVKSIQNLLLIQQIKLLNVNRTLGEEVSKFPTHHQNLKKKKQKKCFEMNKQGNDI